MDIINKPIQNLEFKDIDTFCKEGHREGIQIDYKKDFPQKGLAKHFAAFSNTRGGVIIIGVEEDKKTGFPKKWKGVVGDAKLVERIHQEAGNVDPIPSYQVHATDESEGKCFLIIRVNEGDNTPYYVQNDSNVWVRTGNVSKPIDIASPDGLELLFGKRKKAEKAKSLYLKMAEETYLAGLQREEKKRLKEIEDAINKGESLDGRNQNKLGSEVVMCTIAVQPHFPRGALASPREIMAKIDELRFRNGRSSFPDYNLEPIPEGLFYFTHARDGFVECQQIYGKGLVYNKIDVVRVDENKKRTIYFSFIAGRIFVIFQFLKSFYNYFGYQGNLSGYVSLEEMADIYTCQLKPSGRIFFENDEQSFLPNYKFDIQLDTNVLNNEEALKEYYHSVIREIYWSLGYPDARDDVIDDFLKQNGLNF